MEIHFSGKCDVTRAKTLWLFELANLLVRPDYFASIIINADHGIM
jgi:hypothetical protein